MKKLEDFLVTGIIMEDGGLDDMGTMGGRSGGPQAGITASAAPTPTPSPVSSPASSPFTTSGDGSWNWREHTREENIARGKQKQLERERADLQRPSLYYSTKDKMTGSSLEHAAAARAKAEENLSSGKPLDANDLFYFQYVDTGKGTLSPKNIETLHKQAGAAPQSYELPKATSTDPNADRQTFGASEKRISPMYWVTHKDFETATGERYDPRNARHRQLFFDLNASGESTVSPTAGVGQGPAYDSLEYQTMRRRPKVIPQFGTPEARYDVVDGQIARTVPQAKSAGIQPGKEERGWMDTEHGGMPLQAAAPSETGLNVGKQMAQYYADRLSGGIPLKYSKKPTVNLQSEIPSTAAGAISRIGGQKSSGRDAFEDAVQAWQRKQRDVAPISNPFETRKTEIEGSDLGDRTGSRFQYAQRVQQARQDAQNEFIKSFGRRPNPRSGADSMAMEKLNTKHRAKYRLPD